MRDAEKLAMRMNHRGACACDNDTGDGAGVLTAIPHSYYAHELRLVLLLLVATMDEIILVNIIRRERERRYQ